jgi:hypothetical protein
MIPKFLIVHHSAVSRSVNANQFDAINRYHISKGWGKIGYHYLIEPNGKVEKGRKDNEVGAQCLAAGMNTKSLGICLAGNLDNEEPTQQQIFALRDLLQTLVFRYAIPVENVLGHKETGAKTLCPGKYINMNFVRQLAAGRK